MLLRSSFLLLLLLIYNTLEKISPVGIIDVKNWQQSTSVPPFVESRMRGVRLHDGGQVPPEIRGVAAVVRLHVKRHLQVEVGGFV